MDSHLVSLSVSVGPGSKEDFVETYKKITKVSEELLGKHKYVSVSSSILDDIDDNDECNGEHLYHDEDTLNKVYEAIKATLTEGSSSVEVLASDVINALQNTGILFRERRP